MSKNSDLDDEFSQKLRTSVRSKILKRIYEKNSTNEETLLVNKITSDKKDLKDDVKNESINQQVKRHLSNEWRKTLERVLNYESGHIDTQLDVSRKDGLKFFVQTNWPSSDEDEKTSKTEKKSKAKKKQRKLKNKHQEQEVMPEFLFERKAKVHWKNFPSNKSDVLVLTNEFKIETDSVDETLFKTLSSIIGFRLTVRLVNEKFDLKNFETNLIDFKRNIIGPHLLRIPAKLTSTAKQNCQTNMASNSKFFKSMIDLIETFKPNLLQERMFLNDNRFILNIGLFEVSFVNHPKMNNRDRTIQQLIQLNNEYQQMNSDEAKQKLQRMNHQIDIIVAAIEKYFAKPNQTNSDSNTVFNELKLNIDLLKSLLKQKQKQISERRTTLIDLQLHWNKIKNKKSIKSGNKVEMVFEELSDVNTDQEKDEWKSIVQQRVEQENLFVKYYNLNASNDGEMEEKQLNKVLSQINQNTFLDDGRLPGEPKYQKIELNVKFDEEKNEFIDQSYQIQICLSGKDVANTSSVQLNKTFQLTWNQFYPISISFPYDFKQESIWSFVDYKNHFPVLFLNEIKEDNLKNIATFPLSGLPNFKYKSLNKTDQVEKRFQIDLEDNKIEGIFRFSTFWSQLPSKINETGSSEIGLLFDEEKQNIQSINDVNEINQRLHELRYSMKIMDKGDDVEEYQRHLNLMQLLVQQKYQLEFSSLYEKQRKLNTSLANSNEETFPDGTFCSDEEIESNKRFQMMILRNTRDVNYRDYRFMPLTSTDVLLANVPNQKNEKLAIDVLLDFLSDSCESQEKKVKNKDTPDKVSIDHQWCLAPNNPDGLGQEINWLHIASKVMHRIRQNNFKVDFKSEDSFNNTEIFSLNQIITEQPIESLSDTGFSFCNLFTTKRKLNPSRKDRRKAAINIFEAINRDVQVVLVIQHALNVPLKMLEDEDNSDIDFSKCSTFVEIKFDNNQTMCTSITDGTQPTWNENFKFKVKLNPKQNVYLNLFEVVHLPAMGNSDSIEMDGGGTVDYNNAKMGKCWLGQMKIPLYSLLFNSKIEGVFSLCCPYYLQTHKSIQSDLNESNSGFRGERFLSTINQLKNLYDEESSSLLGCLPNIGLSLFLTTDPPIDSSFHITQTFQSLEPKEIIDFCQKWKNNLQSQHPKRRFQCLVSNMQNKQVLANRFLSAIKPPSLERLIDLNESKSGKKLMKPSIKNAASKSKLHQSLLIHYVSLIPSLVDCTNISIDANVADTWFKTTIWMDCVQFYTFRLGFEVEHAILLCCFLLHLDRNVGLVIGSGLLDGPTAYVILYSSDDSEESPLGDQSQPIIIDAKRGQQFSVSDFNVTLNSVDCIITTDNIYANIQKNSHPNRMNFNYRKSSSWHPLFTKKELVRLKSILPENFSVFNSIQPAVIEYGKIIEEEVNSLESKLETYLREQFMNWRRQHTGSYTVFNRYCTQIIKRILPKLEHHSVITGSRCHNTQLLKHLEEEFVQQAEEIYSIHKIIGYPINVSYRDYEQISRLIYSTGLHLVHFGAPNSVEFIITTYIHPYPCNIYSIWIYTAVLAPKSVVT